MIRELRNFLIEYRWPLIGGSIACFVYAHIYGW